MSNFGSGKIRFVESMKPLVVACSFPLVLAHCFRSDCLVTALFTLFCFVWSLKSNRTNRACRRRFRIRLGRVNAATVCARVRARLACRETVRDIASAAAAAVAAARTDDDGGLLRRPPRRTSQIQLGGDQQRVPDARSIRVLHGASFRRPVFPRTPDPRALSPSNNPLFISGCYPSSTAAIASSHQRLHSAGN